MRDTVTTIATSITGMATTEAAHQMIPNDPNTWEAIAKVLVQVAIGILTAISLFRKPKQ